MAVIWPCVRLPFWQQTLTTCQGHSDKLSALYKYKIYTKETGRFASKGLPFTTADASDFVKSSHVVRNCIRQRAAGSHNIPQHQRQDRPPFVGLAPDPASPPCKPITTSFLHAGLAALACNRVFATATMARSAGGTGSAASLDAGTIHFCGRLGPRKRWAAWLPTNGGQERRRSSHSNAIKSRPAAG